MKWRSKASLSLIAALIVVACGRVADDEDSAGTGGAANSGGAGGHAEGGGVPGSGGSGAVSSGGKIAATGGTLTTGGSIGKGGTPGSGGTALGGSSTGGVVVWGGEAGAGGRPGDYVPLGKGSWNIDMELSVIAPSTAGISCKSASFTMHLEPDGAGLDVISGRDGSVLTGKLARFSQVTPSYRTNGALAFPSKGDCAVSSIGVTELDLRGWDEDFDGIADSLDGGGKASGMVIQGDLGVTFQLGFGLHGVPDTRAPTLNVPASIHPLDGVVLSANEPLALTSTATLTSAEGKVPLTGYPQDEGALGTFSTPVILPFGSTWSIDAVGSDLEGLAFAAATAQVKVIADPGLFAQDGFETAPKALLSGAAQLVERIGNLPAIAGTQSLLVPPNSGATLHLARATGVSKLLLTVQSLASSSAAGGTLPVEVGVIGGSEHFRTVIVTSSSVQTMTGDATWAYAGGKQEVTLPISEPGTDVVIRFAPSSCAGFCPPPQAMLIDDLRVE